MNGPSSQQTFLPVPPPAGFEAPPAPSSPPQACVDDTSFDIFEWSPKYASCQRYFLDHAQHSGPVQALAAFINISLPFQRNPPIVSTAASTANAVSARASALYPSPAPDPASGSSGAVHGANALPFVPGPNISLFPYLRRLVVTGLDFPGVLHGFFGDDWASGIGPLHEQERRNFLFAAKSGGWAEVKRSYDILPYETVPFLRSLQSVVEPELVAAERSWSEWLAMEDWMVGPRTPPSGGAPPTRQN